MLAALQIRANQQSITANLWNLTAYIYHALIIVTGGFSKKTFFIIIFSRTQIFFKKSVERNFEIFTGKHLCWSLFLIKLQALGPVTLRPSTLFQPRHKRDFNTGDFNRVKIAKFLRTAFFMKHLRWLLLSV